ncbi:MAG: carboxypeptidase-like regulatory domain-containing protein, partial [Cyclobacteriaceae bacterium]
MKHLLILIACLTGINVSVQAQRFTISGTIKDAATGENLIGASVYDQKTMQGSSANTYGFYSLSLKSDSIVLTFSYVGYNSKAFSFLLNKDTVINVQLAASDLLDEIIVRADQAEKIHEVTKMSSIAVPIQQIKEMPALLGEVDVLKVLQLLPGVQSGTEGGSGMYVRGGGPDQNLILLDGVPVYNAAHLFGFFSVFNADAINQVELIKGGFPARYGGRLSSVIDINMKEGNMKEVKGEGSIGLIASKLTVEGPIKKDRTSFIISGRRTYIDLLAMPIMKA